MSQSIYRFKSYNRICYSFFFMNHLFFLQMRLSYRMSRLHLFRYKFYFPCFIETGTISFYISPFCVYFNEYFFLYTIQSIYNLLAILHLLFYLHKVVHILYTCLCIFSVIFQLCFFSY